MSEKHIGEVVQVIGPVLDIRFGHDELPALLNAIEIDHAIAGRNIFQIKVKEADGISLKQ